MRTATYISGTTVFDPKKLKRLPRGSILAKAGKLKREIQKCASQF